MKKLVLTLAIVVYCVASFSQQTGTYKDTRDGKVYKTVKIGTQTWFAENLAFKPTKGNYWAYDNDAANVVKSGYLYDWEAAKNVCPSGWHLPSDAEWTLLTSFLGGPKIAGGKLKSKNGWKSPNIDATNSSGFSALPAGYRTSAGSIDYVGSSGYFWSSTADATVNAWERDLYYNDGEAGRYSSKRTDGYSVRCIKN